MRPVRFLVLLSAFLLAPACSAEPDPTVSGHFVSDGGERVELTHVVALRMDGAEGIYPPAVRVLMTDRPVPVSVIDKVMIPRVLDMGWRGEVRGLLVEFDPDDRTRMTVYQLDPGDERRGMTIEDREPGASLWVNLSGDTRRVAGEFAPRQGVDAAFRFDVPVEHDPVQRTLTGAEARDSEFVRTYVANLEAWGRGDEEAVRRLSTAAAARRALETRAADIPGAREMVQAMIQSARQGRVLVRGRTAAIVMGTESIATLERVDGEWKVAD